jgi:hypothetical protein
MSSKAKSVSRDSPFKYRQFCLLFAEVLVPGGGGADDAGGQLWHPSQHLCRLLLH